MPKSPTGKPITQSSKIEGISVMKNLYVVLRKDFKKATLRLLKESAKKRNIKVFQIFTDDFDFSATIKLSKQDGLYNLCDDKKSQLIEKYLINQNVNTFYRNTEACLNKVGDSDDIQTILVLNRKKIPVIKTILALTNNKKLLQKYTNNLDGFPVIIKAIGSSHGIGVIKVESFESLISLSDYLLHQQDQFILRKFIDYKHHARLIVLGNNVVSSIEYKRARNDFRSNTGDDVRVVTKNFGSAVNKIAVNATRSLGYEFSGVDILIDQKNNPYVAEINFPCYFPRAQQATHEDISGKMIDYLIGKSKR